MTAERTLRPWYREPWPWILMSGPAIVVVAGFATLGLAIESDDGLVADDYYRQGLAINRVIARDERAAALGLVARIQFNPAGDRVRVLLSGLASDARPRLTLVHVTRAGEDRSASLERVAPDVYEARLAAPVGGAWSALVEDAARTWRLEGDWPAGAREATLGALRQEGTR